MKRWVSKTVWLRLTCLFCLGLVISLLWCGPSRVFKPQGPISTTELRGVWITTLPSPVLYLPCNVRKTTQQLAQHRFNTIYPNVWSRGYTLYPSKVAKAAMGQKQDPLLNLFRFRGDVLAETVRQGHRQGLSVIPWFEYGLMVPQRSPLARRHPEWLTRSRLPKPIQRPQSLLNKLQLWLLGGELVWLNPMQPQVQQFIVDLITEVVKTYPVDGIQLDDHFALPVNLGYDPFTIERYRQEHGGKAPPTDPHEPEWMRWRAKQLTGLMRKIVQSVRAVKPDCLISLSPNSQAFAYRSSLQDWSTWVSRGLIDELILQVYRPDLASFQAELRQPAIQKAKQQIPVGVGIYTGSWRQRLPMKMLTQQVQLARRMGFEGVSFFYWESLWSYDWAEGRRQRQAGFKTLFAAPAKRPK
ncbi:glycoside hydrolase family 10 protein [Leptolyngbya sp. FACHB-261]|uniref:glycoside hydrolase family 10 protein n=1 Tax=Leptolyngbya sp. FACHB-261 TaxID=2692806 RepID=UPI00168218D8|nr:family 10 glycosylhydrolase [Leptolyngbya sp. FACHB-261]MBD2102357.1 family 10 glycosylhydrolase [Leptolyngbya sp. FACHB-261]